MMVRKARVRLDVAGIKSQMMQVCVFCQKKVVAQHYRACGDGWLPGIFFLFNFAVLNLFYFFYRHGFVGADPA